MGQLARLPDERFKSNKALKHWKSDLTDSVLLVRGSTALSPLFRRLPVCRVIAIFGCDLNAKYNYHENVSRSGRHFGELQSLSSSPYVSEYLDSASAS
ncbi:MAG: hypothetical protein QOC96_48 [Acidobacteriota bacterium]|nr:hypothetical protein [Acidobacteriota bacterium]